jgi:hypothetical protein
VFHAVHANEFKFELTNQFTPGLRQRAKIKPIL